MITNTETAEKISALMLDIFYRLDESITTVRENCSPEETAIYKKAVGRVAAPIVMGVLEPLYEQHPTLKPKNWGD